MESKSIIKLKNKKWLNIVAVSMCIIMFLTGATMLYISKNPVSNNKTSTAEVSQEIRDELLRKTEDVLRFVKEKGYVLTATIGEDRYETFVYNSKGECLSQESSEGVISIRKPDWTSVEFSDKIYWGTDVSIMALTDRAVELAKAGELLVTVDDNVDNSGEYTMFNIEFRGWDKVAELYSFVSDEYAAERVEQLKTAVAENESIKNIENFTLLFSIIIGDDHQLSVGCFTVSDAGEGINWYFDGYDKIEDWELDNQWYNPSENKEKLSDLLNSLMEGISAKLSVLESTPTDAELPTELEGLTATDEDKDNLDQNQDASEDADGDLKE